MGDLFRKRREEMNLSLKEVENVTSIRMMYLQAIEEGKVHQFLSAVYSLGFIRQYASFLGFEHEKLLKQFPEAFRVSHEKQEFAYGIGTLESRGNPQNKVRRVPYLFWAFGAIGLTTLAWYFGKLVGAF
jgi:cytoskeletal protein RodZ